MAWSGKLLGGLIGGMVGGPVGAAAGAAAGHLALDGAPVAPLQLVRLDWTHHAFTTQGPCLKLAPVWRARGMEGQDVDVIVDLGARSWAYVVEVDRRDEVVALPEILVPYGLLAGMDAVEVEVRIAAGDNADTAAFDVDLPSPVRRLGLSGPARLVMALVACARAGGRALTRDDVRFVRETFCAAWPLDAVGEQWLRDWLKELAAASEMRLSADKVADRLAPHLGGDAGELLLWLMRGARTTWPGPASEGWIDAFAEGLGVDGDDVSALWEDVDGDAAEAERIRALATLGLQADATTEMAQAAWRTLVRAHHPDRARSPEALAEATRRTAQINAAWQVLRGEAS